MRTVALITLLILTGCSSQPAASDHAKDAEKQFNERQQTQLLAFMPLSTMFPDPSVRALAGAAGRGDIDEIDRLVTSGADVNARGTLNATPLFWGMKNIVGFRRLLELGPTPTWYLMTAEVSCTGRFAIKTADI